MKPTEAKLETARAILHHAVQTGLPDVLRGMTGTAWSVTSDEIAWCAAKDLEKRIDAGNRVDTAVLLKVETPFPLGCLLFFSPTCADILVAQMLETAGIQVEKLAQREVSILSEFGNVAINAVLGELSGPVGEVLIPGVPQTFKAPRGISTEASALTFQADEAWTLLTRVEAESADHDAEFDLLTFFGPESLARIATDRKEA